VTDGGCVESICIEVARQPSVVEGYMVEQIDAGDLPPTPWVRNDWCPIPRVPSGGKPPRSPLGYTPSPASQVLKPGIMLNSSIAPQDPMGMRSGPQAHVCACFAGSSNHSFVGV
jgi:hypothetical protein